MPTNVGGVTAAALGAFGAALVLTNLISSTGYGGNNKGGTAVTIPTVAPAQLPTSPGKTTTSKATTVGVATLAAADTTLPPTTAPTPLIMTLQPDWTTTPWMTTLSTATRRYTAKSRYFPINDRDVLIIIASIIGALIVIAAIVAIAVYRWRQNRNYGQNYGVRPPSSTSGAFPPVNIQENEYYSTTSSSASPTDIYFDAMKQIPLHRPPDAFMTYSEFGDDEFGPMPPMSYHASTMGGYHKQPPPPMMMPEAAILEYPQAAYPQAAYPQAGYPQAGYPQAAAPFPGPFFVNPPPHY